ncbi:MAG: hypothetical protein KDE19_20130, partial [Caldilineaceae bacterium]|nr:hypothetical protein [Caldilineaceae bacterium]
MFALSTVVVAGGLAYTGTIAYKRLRTFGKRLKIKQNDRQIQRIDEGAGESSGQDRALARINQSLTVSSVALAATVAGVTLKPVLMLVSVPAAIFVFTPTFQEAWLALRRERRITPSVLDATRLTLCIGMGFYVELALDTWLRTLTQRLLLRTEAEFQQTLDQQFIEVPATVWSYTDGAEVQTALGALTVGDIISVVAGELIPAEGIVRHGVAWVDERMVNGSVEAVCKERGDTVFASTLVHEGQIYLQVTTPAEEPGISVVRERLEQMVASGNYLAQAGEQSGHRSAPIMWSTFALLLPFWEANRAAGFLTTSFGSQMGRLGPYALQNFANLALQQNILIYDGRVLETLNLVNTVVIEAALLTDERLREGAFDAIAALRRRHWPAQQMTPQRFAIFLLADGDAAATSAVAHELGFDDYFVEPMVTARAALLDRLRVGGRFVCYVGSGAEDPMVTEKALVTVAIPAAPVPATLRATAQSATQRLKSTTAQVVF